MAQSKVQEWLAEEKLILLQGWARDGLTDEQIAHNMGISVATLYRWKKKHCEICEALKKGKDVVDREVENALHRSATGYYYEEQALTNKGEVVTLRKYQHPNVTAAIFWLKNRKQAEWREKQEHKVDMNQKVIIVEDIGDGGESN